MRHLTEKEVEALESNISEIEKRTDSELTVVVTKKSDNYFYIPALWAGIIALLIPVVLRLTPFWLTGDELLLVQWVAFFVMVLLFRIPPVMMWLLPRSVKCWRASNMARRQFLDNNLHYTKDGSGVLIFISEVEHYVEILADQGINKHVEQDKWQSIVDTLTSEIKAGNTYKGLNDGVTQCGELLAEYVASSGPKNELPNRVVVLN